MPVKVFVVVGSVGEYSDYREWLVRGFLDEKKAKEFVTKCDRFADRMYQLWIETYDDAPVKERIKHRGPDRQLAEYVNGLTDRHNYMISEVPLCVD